MKEVSKTIVTFVVSYVIMYLVLVFSWIITGNALTGTITGLIMAVSGLTAFMFSAIRGINQTEKDNEPKKE